MIVDEFEFESALSQPLRAFTVLIKSINPDELRDEDRVAIRRLREYLLSVMALEN